MDLMTKQSRLADGFWLVETLCVAQAKGKKMNLPQYPAAPPEFEVRADVRDTPRDYVLYLDLPGMEEEDIRIDADRSALEISGARQFDNDNEEAEEYLTIGRAFGDFRYRIEFRSEISPMDVTARYRRGVLRVRAPKRESKAKSPCGGNCANCSKEKAEAV